MPVRAITQEKAMEFETVRYSVSERIARFQSGAEQFVIG